MNRIPSRLYLAIAGLIAAGLAVTVFINTATQGQARLELLVLSSLAAALALALLVKLRLHTAELLQRLRRVAYEDPLTGLPNRARAEEHIDTLLAAEQAEPFALVIIELRNVREINASLGHPVGDEALREVARRLSQNISPGDMVARLTASQFLVILHSCSSERAALLARQLVGVIRAGLHLPDVSLDVQVHGGFSQHPDHGWRMPPGPGPWWPPTGRAATRNSDAGCSWRPGCAPPSTGTPCGWSSSRS
jgi:diguanylate cyclase (GGDEF)-like protein